MNRSGIFTRLALLAALILVPATAGAELAVYADRDAWEAAVPTALLVEDFQSDPPSTYTTPYTTHAGVRLTSLHDPLGIHIQAIFNMTRGLVYSDHGNQLCWSFPDLPANAFGFDYQTDGNDWELLVGETVVTLPAATAGFVGVIDDDRTWPGFVTTCDAGEQDGLSVDDLAVADIFFGENHVIGSASRWLSQVTPTVIEYFSCDAAGTYGPTYQTAAGLLLASFPPDQCTFHIVASWISSNALMHIEYGRELMWSFPGSGTGCSGFGFDYKTGDGGWVVSYGRFQVPLPANREGFVGFVTPGGADWWWVTVSAGSGGFLGVDNVRFRPGSTPARETTWGAVKALY
jgi:hypothetical protein